MFVLRNLNCPNCAAKLQKAAQALPGMAQARVAFGTGALNVEYDPERLAEGEIRNLIQRFNLEVGAVIPGGAA
jgi:copper chaperone CopZ